MIETAQKLKGLIRNLSKGDSAKAQILMRAYATERFFERLSVSPYRKNLIIKGGTLVSAMVGIEARSTMDIDATVTCAPLEENSLLAIVNEICETPLNDNVSFMVEKTESIMDDGKYPGVRIHMKAKLERILIPMKLDFSTGDVITPKELVFKYKLMFEDRTVPIMTYNIETLLAEKLETLVDRGIANTRMRDFYDLYIIKATRFDQINKATLRRAFSNTCAKRGTSINPEAISLLIEEIASSSEMENLWDKYSKTHEYACNIPWKTALEASTSILAAAII